MTSSSRKTDIAQDSGKEGQIGRALRLVRHIADGGSTANLSEVARQTGLNRITATRLLAALEQEAILERLPQGGHRIGIGFLSVAAAALASGDMFGHGRYLLAQLSARLQWSAYMVVPDGAWVLYVLREMPATPLVSNIQPGSRIPAWEVAPGRILLAHQPRERWREAFEATQQHARRKLGYATLERQLKQDRKQGCAWNFSGYESGIAACAAPVFDASGMAVAALSAAGPEHHLDRDRKRREAIEAAVMASAAQLSRMLGHMPQAREPGRDD
ncbi:IclR family transcriptional regulator [Noviherbaspirillum humi]|uniref:IclR family transcriptional regulator n=1 Tax=Noviherbaspirillum humi TaxID=1688639 RepID=UPI001595AA14|nr:IclR family transcriptional regulator [Noviherbaspirillum humi]